MCCLLSIGNTKQALKILTHAGCPSVDERDQQGFYDVLCHFEKATAVF